MNELQQVLDDVSKMALEKPHLWAFPLIESLENKENHLAIKWTFSFLTNYDSDYKYLKEILDLSTIINDLKNSIFDIKPFKFPENRQELKKNVYFYRHYRSQYKQVNAYNNLEHLYYSEFRYQLGDINTYKKSLGFPLLSDLNYDKENKTYNNQLTEECFKAIEDFKNYM